MVMGKAVGELDVAGDLVVGDGSPAVVLDVLFGGGGAVLQLDPGHDLLAVAHVGHADHLDLHDVGVGVEELLDLAGVDVLRRRG